MKVILGEDITCKILNMDRTIAIVIFNDTLYESENNHQECIMENIPSELLKEGINLANADNYELELEKACKCTDKAFRNNVLYGFDVYEDFKTGEGYLVAHYPQNIYPCWSIISEYAKRNDYKIATFTDSEVLATDCKLVLNIVMP